jgi:hypothetical protein
MSPLEFFGSAPLSGRLATVPVGAVCGMSSTSYRGPGRITVTGSYKSQSFRARFLGQEFELVDNIATFGFQANQLEELDRLVAYVDTLFPAQFSGAVPAPIEIEDISGTLNGLKFSVWSSMKASNALSITLETLPLKEYFDTTTPQDFVPGLFMIAAFRYLQQADRLETEGRHLTTFLAERILNVAKSLEAIFPGEVDAMREELAKLGINPTYSDIFATVRYLRNQVDVGHVSFSDLPAGSVQEVFEFVGLATTCLRALLNSLQKDRSTQERLLGLRNQNSNKKIPNAVAYLKKYAGIKPPRDNDLKIVVRE